MIQEGSLVSLEYTLTVDGAVLDTNVDGGDPLTYRQGKHEVLQALEDELEGKTVGDELEVYIRAEDGYGIVEETLFQAVSRDDLPSQFHQAGIEVDLESDDGQILQGRVHEVLEEEVVLDLNHPLAGRDLHFKVKVLSVE